MIGLAGASISSGAFHCESPTHLPVHRDTLRPEYNYYLLLFLTFAHTHRSVYVAPPHTLDLHLVIYASISRAISALRVRTLKMIDFD